MALERDRIAAEFHDEIEQQIFTIGLQLNSLLESGDLSPEIAERLRQIRHLASRTADEVRDVIFALAVEAQSDLTSSLRRLLQELAGEEGLETDLVVTGEATAGVAGVPGAIHAVVKEALNNVVRQAKAHVVLVSVHFIVGETGSDSELEASVERWQPDIACSTPACRA